MTPLPRCDLGLKLVVSHRMRACHTLAVVLLEGLS